MSRLDLLKPGASTKKSEKPKKSSGRGEMLKESTQRTSKRKDDFDEDDLHLEDDYFENELEDPISTQYDIDDDNDEDDKNDKDVNVIELDVDLNDNEALKIDPSFLDDDEDNENDDDDKNQAIDTSQENDLEDEESTLVESKVLVDYSEDDIKAEVEYIFEHRDQAFDKHVKVIQDGGLEITVPKVLHLGDIVRVSVTLSELKEQVGCEGRVVSVFPRSLRVIDDKKMHKYIIQFIGPNAPETERVIYKYLLGYKGS